MLSNLDNKSQNLELPIEELPILKRLFNLDELIEKNAQQKKKEISDKIQDFGEIPLFTEPLVIYGEFEHEVVLQLKSSDTQEDTSDSDNYCTIFGV